MIEKIRKFLKEVKLEMGKITWSTREEVITSTIVVVVVSLLLAIFIGAVDLGLSNLANLVLGR